MLKGKDCSVNAPDAQVDLDLGNYERFLDITLTKDNNLTTGKVYQVPHLVERSWAMLQTAYEELMCSTQPQTDLLPVSSKIRHGLPTVGAI